MAAAQGPWPVYVTLGAIAANHLPGPPVWLGLIAPPSSAKTEILNATLRLPKVQLVTTVSPAALLSGTPKKQTGKAASGGLLRQVGSFGILVLKDFTSVLGLHRDNLSEMLDALREIYDGKGVRHLGTDGGRALEVGRQARPDLRMHRGLRLQLRRDRRPRRSLPPLPHAALNARPIRKGHAAYRRSVQADAGRTC